MEKAASQGEVPQEGSLMRPSRACCEQENDSQAAAGPLLCCGRDPGCGKKLGCPSPTGARSRGHSEECSGWVMASGEGT